MPPSVEQHTCTKSRYFLSQLLTNGSPLSFWKRQCANCFTQEYYIWIHFNTQKHTVWGRDFYTSKKERGRVWLTAIVKKKDQLEWSETRQGEKCSPAASDGLINGAHTHHTDANTHNSFHFTQSTISAEDWLPMKKYWKSIH